MQTTLDSRHELELLTLTYNGRELSAEVSELIVGQGGRVSRGPKSYVVTFLNPVAHAITEEFPAIVGNWLQGTDIGFLRRVESTALRTAMGLALEQFASQYAFALVTAHEVLAVFCEEEPSIVARHG
jgi:hypothetical protein